VLSLYVTSQEAEQRRHSKALLTLTALAGLMVGLGVLLLVGYNWEAMPAAVKVSALVGGVLLAHATGWALRFQRAMRGGSEAAFFFGCLLYGAGIWLIAQIFHINAHDPDGFWWWAVGVLPLALALDTALLHLLFVALMAIWAGYEVLGFNDIGAWLFFGRWSRLPNGAYSLLPLAAPGVLWAYRKGSAQVLALYVPLLAWWVILQPFAWNFPANPVFFIGGVGGLLLLAAEAHRAASPMAVPFRFYGTGLVAGALVLLSFHGFNQWNHGARLLSLQGVYLSTATLVLAVAVLAAVSFARVRSRPDPGAWPGEMMELARRQWFPCGVIASMVALGFYDALTGEAMVPTVAANVAMIALAFWLMQAGLRDDRGRPFAAGVAYFLLWTVLRYVDLFGAFGGMLGAAVMFFLCGAALFGVALFWRRRKEVSLA